jgi:modulator of FtsH protease
MEMNTQFGSAGTLAAGQNRVLRNTYMLLGLSMVPTLLGAMLGIQMNFSFFAGSPFIGLLVFLGIAFGFFWGIEKTKHSAWGVALLLGFTFFMGLMLSRMLQVALGFSNGGTLIGMAAASTGAVFFAMSALSVSIKRDLSFMGKFLFAGMIVLLLAGAANIFLQIPALSLAISAAVAMLFSAYLLFDLQRIVRGGEDNYISATLAVYLSVYNIFASLLHLFMAFGGERD